MSKSNVKLTTQTVITDLTEEVTELSEEDLLLIVGGMMDATGCDNEKDSKQTGTRDCDAP